VRAITYSRYGPPEVLELSEVERPVPARNEILVRVHAVEVTKADCEMRSFRFAVRWFALPLRLAFGISRPRRRILGSYFSGEIAELGANVSGFRVGDAVYGATRLRLGAYAEYLAVPASYTVVPRPATMSHAEAAAVPLGGLNALHFMRRARLAPGDRILINGAGGSIGAHALQIAKGMGAIVTCVDKAEKAEMLRQLGCGDFIDYRRETFAARGRRWDVIFDMVPGSDYSACLRALAPDGRYLSGNPRLVVMLRAILTTLFTRRSASFAFAGESPGELRDLSAMIEAGEIMPIVDRVLPMEQIRQAHRLVETEQRQGAIVLAVGPVSR
jgi:NADPH:quinone reductase-like Zn-dependent oxidoreductase